MEWQTLQSLSPMVSFLLKLNSLFSPQVQSSPLCSSFKLTRSSISPCFLLTPSSHLTHTKDILLSLVPISSSCSPPFNYSLFPPDIGAVSVTKAVSEPHVMLSCTGWPVRQDRALIQSRPQILEIPCTKISFLWIAGNRLLMHSMGGQNVMSRLQVPHVLRVVCSLRNGS